jgi:hypothetical protein
LNSRYLKQGDIDDETTVTFKEVKKENVARKDDEPEYKAVAYFYEFPKGMVMNATNIKRAQRIYGDDTDAWIGNPMILYVDETVEVAGEIRGGLRLKPPRKKVAPATKKSVDDINGELADATGGDAPF